MESCAKKSDTHGVLLFNDSTLTLKMVSSPENEMNGHKRCNPAIPIHGGQMRGDVHIRANLLFVVRGNGDPTIRGQIMHTRVLYYVAN